MTQHMCSRLSLWNFSSELDTQQVPLDSINDYSSIVGIKPDFHTSQEIWFLWYEDFLCTINKNSSSRSLRGEVCTFSMSLTQDKAAFSDSRTPCLQTPTFLLSFVCHHIEPPCVRDESWSMTPKQHLFFPG